MGSLARQLNRRHEVMQAEDYKASGQWMEFLNFCREYAPHGEMEFQSSAVRRLVDVHFASVLTLFWASNSANLRLTQESGFSLT
jgi:hypothetical protein